MSSSSVYLIVQSLGLRLYFDGVTSVSHSLSLKISTDSDSSSSGSDYTVTARNEPDTVTLSVVATDTGSSVAGWAKQTLRTLAQIKEKLLLCKVVTKYRTYSGMLLSSLDMQQDETMQDGWTGTLTFKKASGSAPAAKSGSNASIPVSTGNSSAKTVSAKSSGSSGNGSSSGSVLQTVLREAGIRL